ncbi:hypothetical protein HX005_08240 [Acinetobacter sp. R933-2]|uniref:hypothetical protein n=1 Tax=Acinetobacter sp. R933-2 TaxID=2746728 RepID=UPI002577F53A|nr:hypothetical protein [Acinetobacter sp. R933-2]MDM1247377.1 hypothetical protein [Acinetobacter sp. R933-2]
MLKKIIFTLLCVTTTSTYSFDVYQFIHWHYLKTPDGEMKYSKEIDGYDNILASIGLKKMNVIYSLYLLTDGQADPEKIKKIADATKTDPTTPVCFDIEIGTASQPETNLPVILDALNMYHKFGGKAPIGVYGVLPQSTPNKLISEKQKADYVSLNKKYEEIAHKVDFLAPSIYFYSIKDMNIWNKKAQFSMQEAKKYADRYQLKIYPFVALSNWDMQNKKFFVTPVTEEKMNTVLYSLKSQGANGIVLWESGSSRNADDKMPAVFDTTKGSFKSVVNFINQHK